MSNKNLLLCMVLMSGIILNSVPTVDGLSCHLGRAGCVASCMSQNCATGYCTAGSSGICVCSRCGSGPINPRPW